MEMKPLFDRVIVKRDPTESVSPGGIQLIKETVERPGEGTVLAVGPGLELPNGVIVPLSVKPGDRIFFNRYAGQSVDVNGEEVLFMIEADILAVQEV